MNPKQIYIELCIEQINLINKNIDRNRYKPIYTDLYFLNHIYSLLNDVNSWKSLQNLYNFKHKTHYKTIYNKFCLWSKQNIFKNALISFYNKYYKRRTNLLICDATCINNVYGSENIGVNPEYIKHNISKLSIICDKNKYIHSTILCNVKNKYKKYSTLEHEINVIKNHCNDIIHVNNNSKYYLLIGDKGYITSENIKINNKNVKRIFPKRNNSKKKNNKKNKQYLKNHRYKVEHVNASLKKYARINTRKERLSKYFYSFIYIASLLHNVKVFNKLK
jgi:predicted O-linked N-acetylglucosamine transferase (SPINDLY family)